MNFVRVRCIGSLRHGTGSPAQVVRQRRRRQFAVPRRHASRKASPITSRFRCSSPTARSMRRAGPRNCPAGSRKTTWRGCGRLVSPLARVIEIINLRRTASNLLDTYVGNRAGERILGGQIRRGHTETMHAAIWLSDLRGFTALSDRLPAETVVEILNRYFDCQVAAIRSHGGEVLKFMGDGLLAVFPIAEQDGNIQQVCARCSKPRANPAPASTHLQYRDRRDRRALPFRSGAACRTNSLRQYRRRQPARLHLHRPRRQSRGAAGKDRRPPAVAPSWLRRGLPGSAPAAGPISASFRSRAFQGPNAFTAWRMKRRGLNRVPRMLRSALRDALLASGT